MARLASRPTAHWLAEDGDVEGDVRSVTTRAARAGRSALLVAYWIPGRDCGSYSAGGAGSAAAYRDWIGRFARGLGNRRATVIVEPDAIPPDGHRLPEGRCAGGASRPASPRGASSVGQARDDRVPRCRQRRLGAAPGPPGRPPAPGWGRPGRRLRTQREQLLPNGHQRSLREGAVAPRGPGALRDRHQPQRQRSQPRGRRDHRTGATRPAGPWATTRRRKRVGPGWTPTCGSRSRAEVTAPAAPARHRPASGGRSTRSSWRGAAEAASGGTPVPYRWYWRNRPVGRRDHRLRVIVGVRMNSASVEFEDGHRAVVSRSGLRREEAP